ncbi:MAG: hypothetical protein WCA35_15690 [Kovacikia sp.]
MKSTAPLSSFFPRSFEKLFAGVALTFALSLAAQAFGNAVAHSSEVPAPMLTKHAEVSSTPGSTAQKPLQNGTYLYSQSPKADQIGATYLVFEVTGDRVVGAFYMPQSSFDCFHGNLKKTELALTIVNSYEKTSYPYGVALSKETNSASGVDAAVPTGLAGYFPIQRLSSNDQRILSTCKANFGAHS